MSAARRLDTEEVTGSNQVSPISRNLHLTRQDSLSDHALRGQPCDPRAIADCSPLKKEGHTVTNDDLATRRARTMRSRHSVLVRSRAMAYAVLP